MSDDNLDDLAAELWGPQCPSWCRSVHTRPEPIDIAIGLGLTHEWWSIETVQGARLVVQLYEGPHADPPLILITDTATGGGLETVSVDEAIHLSNHLVEAAGQLRGLEAFVRTGKRP
jgi:hypothetical protein